MKRLFNALLVISLMACGGIQGKLENSAGQPTAPPPKLGTAAELAAGTATTARSWSPKTLSDTYSGAAAEVSDATVGAAGDTDTTHAYSKDDIHDYVAQHDSDYDGLPDGVEASSVTDAMLNLSTPAIGTPASGTLTNATGLPIATGVSGLGTGVATALAVNVGSAGAPVVLNGALGTPSSGTLTNATGLPVATGISGLGTGVATALAVNVGSAGAPVLFNGAGGTPTSLTLTNASGLPLNGLTAAGGAATINSGTYDHLITLGLNGEWRFQTAAGHYISIGNIPETGTHTGAGDAATLTDSAASFVVDELIGTIIYNTTDGSSCTITDNDATTVTCTLSGGTDNDWDASDAYSVSKMVLSIAGFSRMSLGTFTVSDGTIHAQSDTTTAHTAIFAAVRDNDGAAYVNGIVGVNGNSPVMRYGHGSNYYEQDLTTGAITRNGTASLATVEVDRIPITAFTDGAAPPAAAAVISSADGRFNCRAFDGASNEDVFFTWKAPADIDATQGIKFSVSGVVGAVTAPANTEVVAFSLAGVSIGNSDAAGSIGTAQTSSLTADATYAQYDSLDTAFSSAITVTNLAAGETVSLKLIRLAATTDTYAQDFHPHTILIKYVSLNNASF